jgi:hypothetical protein
MRDVPNFFTGLSELSWPDPSSLSFPSLSTVVLLVVHKEDDRRAFLNGRAMTSAPFLTLSLTEFLSEDTRCEIEEDVSEAVREMGGVVAGSDGTAFSGLKRPMNSRLTGIFLSFYTV